MKTSTTIALLRRATANGLLKALHKEGLVSARVFNILPVIDKVDALMRAGKSQGEAVRHVANEFKVHKSTVYRWL